MCLSLNGNYEQFQLLVGLSSKGKVRNKRAGGKNPARADVLPLSYLTPSKFG
jgi:hypothetical protein